MYPNATPKYPKGSPKYNLMQANSMGRKVMKKKASPKINKRSSPKGTRVETKFASFYLVKTNQIY